MNPAALAALLPELDGRGLKILAFYHSHPKGSPRPSTTDVRDANYPDVLYVIVGFGGTSPELGAWEIANGRVLPADLHIGALPSTRIPDPFQLSRSRHAAILISVVIALALLIVISLQLLPPAPPLPVIH
jgi:hypothetical protein